MSRSRKRPMSFPSSQRLSLERQISSTTTTVNMGRADRDRPFYSKVPDASFIGYNPMRRSSSIPRSLSSSSVSTCTSNCTSTAASATASVSAKVVVAPPQARPPSRLPQPRRGRPPTRAPGSPTPVSRTRVPRSNSFLRQSMTAGDLAMYIAHKNPEKEVAADNAKANNLDNNKNKAKDLPSALSSEPKKEQIDNRLYTMVETQNSLPSRVNISHDPEKAERCKSDQMAEDQGPPAMIPSSITVSTVPEITNRPKYGDEGETPMIRPKLPPIMIISPTPKKDNAKVQYKNRTEDTMPPTGTTSDPDSSLTPVPQMAERFMHRNMSGTLTSRARFSSIAVPSPFLETTNIPKECRIASTPSSLPSHKKENVVPVSLLRPVSPTQVQAQIHASGPTLQPLYSQPQPSLPKSRSIGVLSSFRHSFHRSKSSLSLPTRNSSTSSSLNIIEPTPEEPTAYTPENPGPYMWGFKDIREWTGRFSATDTKLRNEFLSLSLEDGPALRTYINSVGTYPELTKPRSERRNDFSKTRQSSACEANAYRESTPPEQVERRRFIGDDDKLRGKKVMEHLATLCKDEQARKSLHIFQQQYARVYRRPDLMPEGSRMEKFMGRVGSRLDALKRKGSSAGDD